MKKKREQIGNKRRKNNEKNVEQVKDGAGVERRRRRMK